MEEAINWVSNEVQHSLSLDKYLTVLENTRESLSFLPCYNNRSHFNRKQSYYCGTGAGRSGKDQKLLKNPLNCSRMKDMRSTAAVE